MTQALRWDTHVQTEVRANPDALWQVLQAVSCDRECGMTFASHVLEV